MPLAVSDTVWNGVIAAIVAVMLAWMNHRAAKSSAAAELAAKAADRAATAADRAAKDAAIKVEEVKAVLEETTADTAEKLSGIASVGIAAAKVGNDTHALVNSQMAAQLRLNEAMAVRLAGLSKGTPDEAEDAAAAKLATAMLEDHEAKQRVVDGESV